MVQFAVIYISFYSTTIGSTVHICDATAADK